MTSPSPPLRATTWRLARYVKPYVALLLLAVLCSLAYAGARAGRAYLVKPLFDDVLLVDDHTRSPTSFSWLSKVFGASSVQDQTTPPEVDQRQIPPKESPALQNFRKILFAALLVVLVIPISHFGQSYLTRYVLGRVLVDLQQHLCAQLLRLPLTFHQSMTRGERLSRATNDATRAHLSLETLFGDVLQGGLAILVGGVVLLSISWQLTIIALLTAPMITGVLSYYGKRIRKTSMERQESFGDVTQRLVEILSSVKVIKAFAAQRIEERSFQGHNLKLFRRSMKVILNRALSRTVVEGLNNAVGVGILVLGAAFVYNGLWDLTAGSLAAFVAVMGSVYRPVKDLTKGWNGFIDAIPAAERFFELLDRPSEPADPDNASVMNGISKGISVKAIQFGYGEEPVLRNVSFEVEAGQVVAIVGKTGAGKTTLVDLLARFYDPDSGGIEIDGVDLRYITRDSLMEHIAIVTQEPILFEATIRQNIHYGRPDASAEEVEAAASAANVLEFTERMTLGLDTPVGESGDQLSGGQRQRITIARAILKNPAVLIFDEATSALDAQSERHVQEAALGMMQGRTVFVIAHRLSTIRHADTIVVLDKGTVVNTGKHEDLMTSEGTYRELVELQLSGESRQAE